MRSRLRTLMVLPALVLGLMFSTAAVTASADASGATRVMRINNAKNIALSRIGDPYRYGAAGPHAFDCSGLIYYSYHRAGFGGMPRTAAAQAGHTRHIAKRNMRPGDLMFFYGSGGVYHVGMFVGRTRSGRAVMVDAPYPGKRVHREVPWTSRWFAGTMR